MSTETTRTDMTGTQTTVAETAGIAPAKPLADYASFQALDIRVGRIVEVLPFPRARNPSWKVGVEFGGDLGIRWSSAQITSYAPEDLIGTQVCCIVNFAPRNIAGFQSEILILGAPSAQGETILVSPRSTVPEGGALF